MVFKGQEIVIPKSLRHYITIAVRIGHFCIEKRAKDNVLAINVNTNYILCNVSTVRFAASIKTQI